MKTNALRVIAARLSRAGDNVRIQVVPHNRWRWRLLYHFAIAGVGPRLSRPYTFHEAKSYMTGRLRELEARVA
jgi:hypothetical protein